MPELASDPQPPIPVLLVGEGAESVASTLVAGLGAGGQAHRFSCAPFPTPESAADASRGAPYLVLVGLGDDVDAILEHPVWAEWHRPGAAMARIAMSDDVGSADTGETPPPAREGELETYRLPKAQA
jgi:hypothetical protein